MSHLSLNFLPPSSSVTSFVFFTFLAPDLSSGVFKNTLFSYCPSPLSFSFFLLSVFSPPFYLAFFPYPFLLHCASSPPNTTFFRSPVFLSTPPRRFPDLRAVFPPPCFWLFSLLIKIEIFVSVMSLSAPPPTLVIGCVFFPSVFSFKLPFVTPGAFQYFSFV